MTKIKVLDTNILLIDAHNIINLGKDGSTIVLPETVLDELDSKKSLLNELGFQAREAGRLLTKATNSGTKNIDGKSFTLLTIDNISIVVVAFSNYKLPTALDPKIVNDRKIIAVAEYFSNSDEFDCTFITNDIMCYLRANSLGIKAEDLKQITDTEITFTKSIEVGDELFRTLHYKAIEEVDSSYRPQYFNYVITNPTTDQIKLGVVVDGKLQVIGRETETDLRKQDINPANSEQLFFSRALQDTSIDINICESKAGSGKTAVAISNGIRNIRKGLYDQLIYIRASVDDVDKVEEIGFLAGNDEKMAVYLHPLHDTIDYIVRSHLKGSKLKGIHLEEKVEEGIEKLISECNIQAMIGLGLRGRTFNNAYVVIDEAQNQSKASMQKMLTRFGKGCKIVVIGSNKQIDNPFLTKYTNALSVLLDACKRTHPNINLHAVSLPKVVRGPIAEFAEDLYSNNKG